MLKQAGLVADGEPIPVERERPELATVTVLAEWNDSALLPCSGLASDQW